MGINMPMDWIEGIGSTLHPFYSLECITDNCENSWNLLCYDSIGVRLYKDSLFNTCDTSFTNVGLKELANSIDFKVYPNPATNYLTIETPQQAVIEITNIEGQLIKSIVASGKTNIDVSSLTSGVYIVQVKSEKVCKVGKFVKE